MYKKEDVWDSELRVLRVEDFVKVVVDADLVAICKAIQNYVGNNEFSILAKGYWEDDCFHVTSQYVIPRQEVSVGSVNYKEVLQTYRSQGYNVVIHSHGGHPALFSYADHESINIHFTCSLLFDGEGFSDGVVTVQVSRNLKLQLKAKTTVTLPPAKHVEGLENIEIRRTPQTPQVEIEWWQKFL